MTSQTLECSPYLNLTAEEQVKAMTKENEALFRRIEAEVALRGRGTPLWWTLVEEYDNRADRISAIEKQIGERP